MTKIVGAIAAIMLALVMFSPPAAARCWWQGHHRHCSYHRGWVGYPYYRPVVGYQYYNPSYYQPYPYYASYPRPPYAYNYHACFPIWPFCW